MINRQENKLKIKERCIILSEIINAIIPIYNKNTTSEDQRNYLETIIGASLWYLPKPQDSFTGYISKKLLREIKNNNKYPKSEEHIFPRKQSARELLNEKKKNAQIEMLYRKKYCKICLITREENKCVVKYQKSSIFKHPEEVYKQAKIELVKISQEEYEKLLKNQMNIDELLSRNCSSIETESQ